MNPDLLNAVKTMKFQGYSEEAILKSLTLNYPANDVAACLAALKNMQPEKLLLEKEETNLKSTKKHSVLIYLGSAILIIIFGLVLLAPQLYRLNSNNTINKRAQFLADKYDVSKVYDAGSAMDCQSQGPTNFGEITSLTVCDKISAKIFYPTIRLEKLRQKYVTDPNSGLVSDVSYVDNSGRSLAKYIMFGIPGQQPGQGNPFYVETNLKLPPWDHLVFSGVYSRAEKNEPNLIDGKWLWLTDTSWLGLNTPGSKLQAKINKKILADQAPAKGAPTPSQAFSDNKAPLVVYFISRTCHSPKIIFLDKQCSLPN